MKLDSFFHFIAMNSVKYKKWWELGHRDEPLTFPVDMPISEWIEDFNKFLEEEANNAV